MKLGIIGLGKMGSRIAQKLYEENHEVLVWNRSFKTAEDFVKNLDRGPAAKALKVDMKIFSLPTQGSKKLNLKIEGSNESSENFASPRALATIEELVLSLSKPRIIWLMLPAGEATQSALDEVQKFLQKGTL